LDKEVVMSLGTLRGCFAVWYSKSGQRRDWAHTGTSRYDARAEYRTRFLPGAFRGALKRALGTLPVVINHDMEKRVGFFDEDCEIFEAGDGLRFILDLPETAVADEVVRAYESGQLNGCSLHYGGPRLKRRSLDRLNFRKRKRRDIVEVEDLFEVTLCIGNAHPCFGATKETLTLEGGRRLPSVSRSAPDWVPPAAAGAYDRQPFSSVILVGQHGRGAGRHEGLRDALRFEEDRLARATSQAGRRNCAANIDALREMLRTGPAGQRR
jgi:HK97 family phage prohead protease